MRAHDEELTFGDDAKISGSQPGRFGGVGRGSDEPCTERALGFERLLPITLGHVVTVHPDLTYGSRRALDARIGIDDADNR